jgi:hypothetical protein
MGSKGRSERSKEEPADSFPIGMSGDGDAVFSELDELFGPDDEFPADPDSSDINHITIQKNPDALQT